MRAVLEVGLEDRFQHKLCRRLHHPVAHRRNPQRPLRSVVLRDVLPPHRLRPVLPCAQPLLGLSEERLHARLLDLLQGLPIHAGSPSVGSDSPPCLRQDVTPADPVIQRMEAPPLAALGSHEKSALKFSHFVCGGVGPSGHALALPPSRGRDEARAPSLHRVFPSRLLRYYEPLGLPLGTAPFRLRLIGTAVARRGPPRRVSPVPFRTVAACRLPYPGSVLRASGLSRTVCCLRRDMIGSATPPFGSYLTRLQSSRSRIRPAALLPTAKTLRPPVGS